MSTIFYDHLIDWPRLEAALVELELEHEELEQIREHTEQILHAEVIMVLVAHLPEEKHEEFITRFHAAPHDPDHLHFVVSCSTTDVESAVRERANEVIDQILIDLES